MIHFSLVHNVPYCVFTHPMWEKGRCSLLMYWRNTYETQNKTCLDLFSTIQKISPGHFQAGHFLKIFLAFWIFWASFSYKHFLIKRKSIVSFLFNQWLVFFLKSPISIVQRAYIPKNGVEFRQQSNGDNRSGVATS